MNSFLHKQAAGVKQVAIANPDGAHNIAVGLDAPIAVDIDGHAGYYAAGMNKLANVTISGSAGTGVAENMMSGRVHVKGFASNGAGASMQGGLLVIDGDAGLRCGISLKGGDIVVGGSVGSFSAFMAQAGRMVICGNAGDALGDSLYEAVLYVKGDIKSLGADAQIEPMTRGRHRGGGRTACGSRHAARSEIVQAHRLEALALSLERGCGSGILRARSLLSTKSGGRAEWRATYMPCGRPQGVCALAWHHWSSPARAASGPAAFRSC